MDIIMDIIMDITPISNYGISMDNYHSYMKIPYILLTRSWIITI